MQICLAGRVGYSNMTGLHLWVAFSFIFSMVLWRILTVNKRETKEKISNAAFAVLLISALVLRLILAATTVGFEVDIGCFSAWSDRMAEVGPLGFYADDYFSDYPPMYLYILGVVGLIRGGLAIEWYSPLHIVLLKLPSILADLGTGLVIYRTASKHISRYASIFLASLYLFQPVVIMNSCLWGQIDSLFTFVLVLVCAFLEKGKYFTAYIFFGIGILLKPQMLIFAPIILVAVLEQMIEDKFSKATIFRIIGEGVTAVAIMFVLALPFGLEHVLPQYLNTLASYPYATVNAYNLWAGLGLNWAAQDTIILGIPCSTWGTISIVAVTICSLLLGLKMKKNAGRFSLVGALLIITVFTFSVRMHERYLYPVMALLLMAYPGLAESLKGKTSGEKHSIRWLLYGCIFSLLICMHFYNTGHVLYFYDPYDFSADKPIIIYTGIGTTIGAVLFYLMLIRICMLQGRNKQEKNRMK